MDRRGGCCIARYTNDSKVDLIMQRFRPIAPKPTPSGGASPPVERSGSLGCMKTGRGRKKRCSTRKKKLSATSAVHDSTVVTLPLLPETPDLLAEAIKPGQKKLPVFKKEIKEETLPRGERAVVWASVTVERVTATWGEEEGLGSLFTDEEKMRRLEEDTRSERRGETPATKALLGGACFAVSFLLLSLSDRMILQKAHPAATLHQCYHRLVSTISSASDTYLADKAIIFLKRHPHQLPSLLLQFTPAAASNLLRRSQSDRTVILKFLDWASPHQFFNSQCKCHALHILTRFKLFKTAQSLAQDLIREQEEADSFLFLFHCLRDSYHEFSSSSAVFDLMVKSYSGLNMSDAAVNIIALAKANGFMPSVLSYNSVLDSMIRSRMGLLVVEGFYDEMLKTGVSPNVFTYNIVIKGCCGVGELGKAFGYFEQMKRNGCLPSVVTYNTLMDAHCKAGDVEKAFVMLKSMTMDHMEPSLVTYNVIINGLCHKGRMQEADEVIGEMKRKGRVPDEVTYNTMVNGYCKEGNFHQALVLHEEIVRNGLCPDVVTYTALINGMCKAKNLTRAMQFFDQMRSKGIQPNQRTYTTLIDGFSQQGFLNEAYQFLKEMLESGFSPSAVTYNTLINGHCALGKMEDALNVINDMVEKGLTPDVVSYSAIISGFCKNRELDKAFQMKRDMVAKDILPDTITYSTLIQGLCDHKRLHQACDLFSEMLSVGLAPDEFTYTTLMNAYCKEGDIKQALKLHSEMIQKGFLPDVVTYSVLINGLTKQARTREAKKLLMRLYCEDSVPDDITYNALIESCSNTQFKDALGLIKGFCMKGLMNEADQVFKSMAQKGYKPNNAVYDVLVHGHGKNGDVPKAYDLYKEMVRLGFTPHAVTVVALIKALTREEMSKELGEMIDDTMKSCKLGDAELAKSLVEINHKEGNMDAVLDLITEMAKDGLLPNGGRID